MTNDKQRLDLDDGRQIQSAGFDTVGRFLIQHPLDCGDESVGPDVLESAAGMMRTTDSEYAPVVVDLEYADGDPKDAATVIAPVNTENGDDVIVLAPRHPKGGDGL